MSSVQRFFGRYLKRYVGWYVAGTAALAATNAISVEIPLVLARSIDALGTPAADRIPQDAALVAVLGVVVIAVRTASRLLFFTPGRLVEAELKRDLFDRLIHQQPAFLRQWPTGDLISRSTSDVNMARLLAGFTVLGVVNMVVAFAVTGVQMVRISPLLAGATLVPLLVGFLITQRAVRSLHKWMVLIQQQAADLSDHILSSYQGIATIRAFDARPAFQKRFEDLSDAWLDTSIKRTNLRVAIGPTLSLAASTNVFLLLFLGGPMAIRGEITVGELVAFTTLVAFLTGPLRGMSFIISLWKQSEASLDRLEAVMDPKPVRPELDRPGGPLPAPTRPPEITLRNLHFAWPGSESTLSGIDLVIPAGTTLGVFGATGAGKSTLLSLIARLDNPPPGTVLVDGVDLVDLDLDGWRRITSLVSQRPFLFSESVRDNILLGERDDGRLAAIVADCALAQDVASFPQGLDTVVGEAGVTLSGGQRQRVALARGLVRPHLVRLLDDVLSAVDAATESRLIETLQRFTGDVHPTTLLVSHRISALRHAEQIAVIEGGRLLCVGTHDELVHRPGPYRETWLHQSEQPEEEHQEASK